MTWTKPFIGVSHLLTLPYPYQVSVSDYGSFVNLTIYNLQIKPFTRPLLDEDFKTVADAKKRGENWAAQNAKI